ncbi:uncharacterized protein V1516DRAFT_713669 [Lipomyces oligophaga]|uniref:uncharacterized protein n=1 Tax=Lipomyces oligophaga TaxID=45792 RepID=UPI0034CE3B59
MMGRFSRPRIELRKLFRANSTSAKPETDFSNYRVPEHLRKLPGRVVFEPAPDLRPPWLQKLSSQFNVVKTWYYRMTAKHPFLAYGGPFLTFMVVASYYLSEFTEIRYQTYDGKITTYYDSNALSQESARKLKHETPEQFYARQAKLLQSEASEDYEMKRIERREDEPPAKW